MRLSVIDVAACDRALGALVGLAIGDALGAPVEFCRRDTFEPVTGMRAGGYFKLPAGAWTDDTAMTLRNVSTTLRQWLLDFKLNFLRLALVG